MQSAALYILVQILAYSIDVGTFVLLESNLAIGPALANFFAKCLAGLFAFFSHRHLTFEGARTGALGQQALRYALLLLANGVASSLMLVLLLQTSLSPVIAKVAADVVLIIISFSLSRSIVFRGIKAGQGQ